MTRRSLTQRLSGALKWSLADSAESHTRAEKVRILYRQGPPAQLIGILAAAVICWVLWDVTDHLHLLVWWAVLTLVILGRIALAYAYRRADPLPMTMQLWEHRFVVSLGLVSLIWGLGGWLIMPAESPLHQAVVYFFLLGVTGAVVAAYSAHATASLVAVLAVMLPPTIGLAVFGTFETRVMAAGGVLYVTALFRSTQILAFFLRRTFELSFELREAYAHMREQARTDELTGLANRRAFIAAGEAAVDQSIRYERALSILMMDIDHFKQINDTHGHAAGDAAIRAVADALRAVARQADTPGRLGGEEFAVLLPETARREAVIAAERLRAAVRKIEVDHEGTTIRFTCSVGLVERTDTVASLDEMLSAADEALYAAKANGRNRVEEYRTGD
jgi:diguanylate cyclase (GGDEF)-like protein